MPGDRQQHFLKVSWAQVGRRVGARLALFVDEIVSTRPQIRKYPPNQSEPRGRLDAGASAEVLDYMTSHIVIFLRLHVFIFVIFK